MATERLVKQSTQDPHPPAELLAPSLAPPADAGAAADAPSISVVIPAKNEGGNVGWVLQSMPRWVDEVILVDGNSTDRTVDLAKREWPGLVVVGQRRPGKGAALREGFASARGDIVVMIDADGSMDPGEIDRYVKPLIDGECDMVKGSRWLAGGGSQDITPFRKLGNKMLLTLVNRLFGSEFTELCYGFMAFSRTCVDKLELTADGFEIETQIVLNAVRAGMRVEEVASVEAPRRCGRSNLRPIRDGLRVLATVFAALFGGVTERTEGGLGLDGGVTRKGGWPKTVQFDRFE
ncbi:MAG: glycosyltransferase family 2 protein [Actinomycetota bacterium]